MSDVGTAFSPLTPSGRGRAACSGSTTTSRVAPPSCSSRSLGPRSRCGRSQPLQDFDPGQHGTFDVVLFYGVLYHLRYPFDGLRRLLGVLREGGHLLIESGMVADPAFDALPLLYCPVDESPYAPDWTSCTFFTERGLAVTLESLGAVCERSKILGARPRPRWWRRERPRPSRPPQTARQFLVFRKDSTVAKPPAYWEARRRLHTEYLST